MVKPWTMFFLTNQFLFSARPAFDRFIIFMEVVNLSPPVTSRRWGDEKGTRPNTRDVQPEYLLWLKFLERQVQAPDQKKRCNSSLSSFVLHFKQCTFHVVINDV